VTTPTDIDPDVQCSSCLACCCRLQVLLLPGDKVPAHFVDEDDFGNRVMARLDDGWCAALDRQTQRCSIYAQRPFLCAEYAMGGAECRAERAAWGLDRRAP
jgi:Fe-S-cluster containining protein